MLNKSVFLFLLLLLSSPLWAQNVVVDTAIVDAPSTTVMSNDSLLATIKTDTASIQTIHFDTNFRQKYADKPEFDYSENTVGEGFFSKLKKMIGNLLRSLMGLDNPAKINQYTTYFLWGICVIIFGVLIYLIVKLMINYKGRWFFERKKESIIEVTFDNVEEHIQEANFASLIQQAEQQNNIRQSIRLHYLWLLKSLDARGLIVWNREKTNADYAREIKNINIQKDFEYLSYLYNYIWYGEFSINDTEYINAKKAFQYLLNK